MKLSCCDQLDQVLSVMKTKIHDMTNLISEVYVENDTQLSWPIRSGADYDEYQIGQLHD